MSVMNTASLTVLSVTPLALPGGDVQPCSPTPDVVPVVLVPLVPVALVLPVDAPLPDDPEVPVAPVVPVEGNPVLAPVAPVAPVAVLPVEPVVPVALPVEPPVVVPVPGNADSVLLPLLGIATQTSSTSAPIAAMAAALRSPAGARCAQNRNDWNGVMTSSWPTPAYASGRWSMRCRLLMPPRWRWRRTARSRPRWCRGSLRPPASRYGSPQACPRR